MSTLRIIALAILLVVLNGCGGKEPQPQEPKRKAVPNWYLSPPANSPAYLYGIGEGKNRDEAIKYALENMVSTLGVSIASSYASKTSVQRGYRDYYQHSSQADIKSEVAQVRVSNYEVVETHQQRYNHYIVLVRSDKKAFKNGLTTQLRQTYSEVEAEAAAVESANVLKRYGFYAQKTEVLRDTVPTLLLLKSLDETFDDTRYLQTIETHNKRFARLKNSMSVSVHADSKTKPFSDVIQTAVTDVKLPVTALQKVDTHLRINLSHTMTTARSHGFDIARIVLLIDVRDYRGKSIGGKRIQLTGQATQGVDVAVKNAAAKLQERIRAEGIMQLMGIDF